MANREQDSAAREGTQGKDPQQVQQETTTQRQQQDLQQHRRRPSDNEEEVRREQGGHDRPVRQDHVPGRRPQARAEDADAGAGGEAPTEGDRSAPGAQGRSRDPKAGVDREVGDLEDPDATDDGALPGRVGGGLAGG